MEALINLAEFILQTYKPLILVIIATGGFFYFSRHWLKREIFKDKTLISMIVSVGIFFVNIAFAPFVFYTNQHVSNLYADYSVPSIPASVWEGWPVWALIIVSLLAYDLIQYWTHRLLHMKWLWPIHAIHHSDPDVNGLTTYRVHFLEIAFSAIMMALFLPWFGMPKDVSGMTAVFLILSNAYTHFDVDWGHGPLRYVIASPRFHRWHHADTPELYGKNLANMFPFFDVLFGTYHVPGICLEPMGAKGVPENNLLKLVLFPMTETVKTIRTEMAQKRAAKRQRSAEATPAE